MAWDVHVLHVPKPALVLQGTGLAAPVVHVSVLPAKV